MSMGKAVKIAARIHHATQAFQMCATCRHIQVATRGQIESVGECGLCQCGACDSWQCTTKTREVLKDEGYPVT